jgi:hypothetical protein
MNESQAKEGLGSVQSVGRWTRVLKLFLGGRSRAYRGELPNEPGLRTPFQIHNTPQKDDLSFSFQLHMSLTQDRNRPGPHNANDTAAGRNMGENSRGQPFAYVQTAHTRCTAMYFLQACLDLSVW